MQSNAACRKIQNGLPRQIRVRALCLFCAPLYHIALPADKCASPPLTKGEISAIVNYTSNEPLNRETGTPARNVSRAGARNDGGILRKSSL